MGVTSSLPGPKVLFRQLKGGTLPIVLVTTVMNVSKEAMRGISFSLSLYLFLSIMIMDCIYVLCGSVCMWKGDQGVINWCKREEIARHKLWYFGGSVLLLLQFFRWVSKQLSSLPEGVKHWWLCYQDSDIFSCVWPQTFITKLVWAGKSCLHVSPISE